MSQTGKSRSDTPTKYSPEWFAMSSVRVGLAGVGFILLLFALGQAVGFDLLELLVAALTSHLGRWLVVAVFGLILIAIALKGFNGLID